MDKSKCNLCSSKGGKLINLIDCKICNCKGKIHIKCLAKNIERTNYSKQCQLCGVTLNYSAKYQYSMLGVKTIINFPQNRIYKSPLTNEYVLLEEDNINLQLHYAILYLEYDTVKILLDKISDDEFNDYLTNADYFSVHKTDVKLRDNMYSNLPREFYNSQYYEIEKLLSNKRIKRMLDSM